jgi:hypothetical protein
MEEVDAFHAGGQPEIFHPSAENPLVSHEYVKGSLGFPVVKGNMWVRFLREAQKTHPRLLPITENPVGPWKSVAGHAGCGGL